MLGYDNCEDRKLARWQLFVIGDVENLPISIVYVSMTSIQIQTSTLMLYSPFFAHDG